MYPDEASSTTPPNAKAQHPNLKAEIIRLDKSKTQPHHAYEKC